MNSNSSDLLPITARVLTANQRLAVVVQQIGNTYGYNYFDDMTVRRKLADYEASLSRASRGGVAWASGITITVGITWLLWVMADKQEDTVLTYVPPVALLVLAVGGFERMSTNAKKQLRHPFLVGYRHVLSAAHAHGAPVTFVPSWLTGHGQGDPLPPYTPPPGVPGAPTWPPPTPGFGPPPVMLPPKPAAVTEYERIADKGGWHDELGMWFLIGGGIGMCYAVGDDRPMAFAAVILFPLALWTWVAGHRLGKRQQELAGEAHRYVEQLVRAQAAGAVIPELSPQLRVFLSPRL